MTLTGQTPEHDLLPMPLTRASADEYNVQLAPVRFTQQPLGCLLHQVCCSCSSWTDRARVPQLSIAMLVPPFGQKIKLRRACVKSVIIAEKTWWNAFFHALQSRWWRGERRLNRMGPVVAAAGTPRLVRFWG